ncbi:MAG: triose-phosphate isomerase [Promethearchaeia archaeon]
MRKFAIGGNWKLKVPKVEDSVKIAKAIASGLEDIDLSGVDVFIGPSYNALYSVGKAIEGTKLKLAGQNMYFRDKGAFTGEISPDALLEAGCEYVILGHSERRRIFGEDNEYINKKVLKALEKGLKVVLCIGESAKERQDGKLEEINTTQLKEGLAGVSEEQLSEIIIAYEPVWAINNEYLNPGVEIKAATPDEAKEAHALVRNWFKDAYSQNATDKIQIQYGGSMKPANCGNLLPLKNIDGGLIGTASIAAETFIPIVKKASELYNI